MGRYVLILGAVWGAYALVHAADVDPRMLFWAALLPGVYIAGMWLLHDPEQP